jgi:3-hydroxyisobutyrate dehydrogenase
MSAPTIGFVGLGSMGWPMAARLVTGGFELLVSDAAADRAAQFAAQFGATAMSVAALVPRCDVLITMLPSSAVVEQVFAAEAVETALRAGTLLLEMSSGVPSRTLVLATRLAGRDITLVDAPVSGGVKRAEAGDLAIMVGGNRADIERARPILQRMGSTITPTGAVGSAHAMKALNNLVSAAGFAVGIEALLVGIKFGLDPSNMVDVLNASTGMNNATLRKFKQFVLSGRFDSGFGLDLLLKDLGIALDLAHDTKTPVPLSAACRELWSSAAGLLGPGRDHTEMARLSERLAGLELAAVAAHG